MRPKNPFLLLTLVLIFVGLSGSFTLVKASGPPASSLVGEHRLPQVERLATPAFAFRINAGGANFTDSVGNLFVADKAYTSGDFGYLGGGNISTSSPIDNTTDDPLFQSQRIQSSFSYLFDNLPPDDYVVTLHFAEIQFTAPGKRIFDVTIEGNLLIDNYDIFVAAGGANTAVMQTFLVPVSDGQLNIVFSASAQRSAIAAIEVVSSAPAEPAPDIAVSPGTLDFGEVDLGSSSEQNATIYNLGTLDLYVSSLITTNPAYSLISPATPFTVTAGSNVPVTVRFTPVAAGIENGSLEISSDDPDEPQLSLSLAGNGVEPPTDEQNISASTTLFGE